VPVPPPRPHTTPITIDALAMEFDLVPTIRFIAAVVVVSSPVTTKVLDHTRRAPRRQATALAPH
jgi:hypothetical protein